MKWTTHFSVAAVMVGVLLGVLNGCASQVAQVVRKAEAADVTAEIIALERAALERWNHGDPTGYLETYAPDITYFDPTNEHRINGFDAMKAYYAPITGKVKSSRYDMIEPKVQRYGEVAVLSFQLISYGSKAGGGEFVQARWNSTEVYRQTEGGWKIAHNHWSFIKPALKVPPGRSPVGDNLAPLFEARP